MSEVPLYLHHRGGGSLLKSLQNFSEPEYFAKILGLNEIYEIPDHISHCKFISVIVWYKLVE